MRDIRKPLSLDRDPKYLQHLGRNSMPSNFQESIMAQLNTESNFDFGSLMNYEFPSAAGSFQNYTDVDSRTSATDFTPTVCYPTIAYLPHSSLISYFRTQYHPLVEWAWMPGTCQRSLLSHLNISQLKSRLRLRGRRHSQIKQNCSLLKVSRYLISRWNP